MILRKINFRGFKKIRKSHYPNLLAIRLKKFLRIKLFRQLSYSKIASLKQIRVDRKPLFLRNIQRNSLSGKPSLIAHKSPESVFTLSKPINLFSKTPLVLPTNFIKSTKIVDNKIINSIIFKKLLKPFFVSKEKTSFLLRRGGFLFISERHLSKKKKPKMIYTLKKTLYSFSYKNELQRFILKKYIRNYYRTGTSSIRSHFKKSDIAKKVRTSILSNNFSTKRSPLTSYQGSSQLYDIISSSFKSTKSIYFENQFVF
jgi:hypothetical protein